MQLRSDPFVLSQVFLLRGIWPNVLSFIGDFKVADRSQISITHVDSKTEPCIQAVDFIAGAVHQNYRSDETTYYHVLQEKMIIQLDNFHGRKE